MKTLLLFALCLPLAACLTGCMHGAAGDPALMDKLTELAKDPNCAHRDTINVILGPVPSGTILLDRNCPGPSGALPPGPPPP